ncbi:flagellar protein FliO/FliZ [Enterobacter sp. BIGb0383]|uniref:flagellar biosynthetic protein FliO n=1 Tax=unclassified Enterobacter TaxID=2608935 RepID=UPI000F4A7600|nr:MULTISPECIES: flagellar biosynthetic protein FliO [unclassified Enterobacter]ROP58337.1 flagellar protein FliO/FliZ [Enterobacter sp. BIGb0383]ROS06775.1 flagellar protein FliO/FliZ [Enterobacter sp. BIGb0359]
MKTPLQPQSQAIHMAADPVSSGAMLFQLSGALLLILALILAIGWLIRRRGWGTSLAKGKTPLTIEQRYSLGQREQLAIVNVDARRFLLGMTPGSITLLTELAGAAGGEMPSPGSFQQALTQTQDEKRGANS